MDVTMNREMVRKRLYKLGDKTQAKIAERLNCDEGTARRILNGASVRLNTAEKVSQILLLDPLEVINFGINKEEQPTDTEEQISEADQQNAFFTEAEQTACDAAGESMNDTLNRYGAYNREEVSNVLSLLLLTYGVALSYEAPTDGLLFIDEITHKAKRLVYLNLLKMQSEDTTDSD